MAAFSRLNIAKALSIIGLKKTYVALKKADSLTINRLTTSDGNLALEKIGILDDANPKVIGRVGMPDPKLGIKWKNSMTFYGSWFDGLALSDTDYRIRNNILSLSKDKLLDQVKRDDKYGLIGTYYAVFLKIINLNKGVPMVLLDDSLLSRGSFPVIVPRIPNKEFERELIDGLLVSLRKEIVEASMAEVNGLSVDEVSGDVSDYFPARTSQ
ncbi:MAG: hypothetical protein ACI9BW_001339 [Gammaproteobacteria bacterium]|jgi:hypothetical protein